MSDDQLAKLVNDPTAKWDRSSPATLDAIIELKQKSPVLLPDDYLHFLTLSNGGYGVLSVQPWRFRLWPAEDVLKWNHDHERDEFYPDLFLIGWLDSNLFAFLLSEGSPSAVVAMDYLDSKRECINRLGETFTDFAALFGRESE